MDWEKIGIIAAVIMSLATAIKVIWFMPKESRQLDKNIDRVVAETADIFERAATSAAERALKLDERLKCLEQENTDMQQSLELVREENTILKRSMKTLEDERASIQLRLRQFEKENKAIKRWAEKLVQQIVDLRGQPIPFDPNAE